jgi:hypothetical protein
MRTPKIAYDQVIMIDPMAPYKASQMTPRLGGAYVEGTTDYCRQKTAFCRDFDYQTLSILGQAMTKGQMLELFKQFVRNSSGYGKRGGDYAEHQANRYMSCFEKEGFIIVL